MKTLSVILALFGALVAGILPCTSVAAQSSEPKIVVVTPPRPLPDRIDFVRKTRTQWFNHVIQNRISEVVITVFVNNGQLQSSLPVRLNGSGHDAIRVAVEKAIVDMEKFVVTRQGTNDTLQVEITGDYNYPRTSEIFFRRTSEPFSLEENQGKLRFPIGIVASLTSSFTESELRFLPVELPGVTRFALYRKIKVEPYEDRPDFDFDPPFDSAYRPTQVTVRPENGLVRMQATDEMLEALSSAPYVGIIGDSGQINRYRGDTGMRVPLIPIKVRWQGFYEGEFATTVKTEPRALFRVSTSTNLVTWTPLEGNYGADNIGLGIISIPQTEDPQFFLNVELAPQ